MDSWEEKYLDIRKRSDGLEYEIGGYLDEIRMLKTIAKSQDHKINVMFDILNTIRNIHREHKQYEVADIIRKHLTDLGFEVKDK